MLSISAIESSHQTATELDEKGIALVIKPGSLLSPLISATYIDYDPKLTEGGYHVDMSKMATMTTQATGVTGFSEHAARMEETAEFLAKQLEGYLLHARTVCAPFVDEYAQRLSAQEALISGSPSSGVNVTVRRGHHILLEPALMDAYSRSREVVYEALNHLYRLPEKTEAELHQMLQTGSTVLDAVIVEYFSAFEEGWLSSLYQSIFRSGGANVALPEGGIDALYSGRDKVAQALAVFLIARRLWNAPPEGTDMPLATYESAMVDLRNQAALRLCQEYDRMMRDGNTGILVCGTRNVLGQIEIEVNKEQYDLYLKKGGSVDALLGNQLQPHPEVLTESILSKKEMLEASWQRHYNINKSYFDQRKLLGMRAAVVSEWFAMVETCSHEEFSIAERHVAGVLVRRMAETVSLEDLQDIPLLALKIVCRARFPKSADEAILLGMRRAKQNNPAITSQEAATISLLEYLYKWVGDNIEVVSANKLAVFGAQDHMHGA